MLVYSKFRWKRKEKLREKEKIHYQFEKRIYRDDDRRSFIFLKDLPVCDDDRRSFIFLKDLPVCDDDRRSFIFLKDLPVCDDDRRRFIFLKDLPVCDDELGLGLGLG